MPADWLIYSKVNDAWWRPDCAGYTDRLDLAGLYTEEHVRSMFSSTWPEGDGRDKPVYLTSLLPQLTRERDALRERLSGLLRLEGAARAAMAAAGPLDFQSLPPRIRNLMKEEGLGTLHAAAAYGEGEFRRIPGVGPGTIQQLKAVIGAAGLELAP